jgi:chloride channel 3/4/5
MSDIERAGERTALLHVANNRRVSAVQHEDANSTLSSHVSKDEQILGESTVGERLPYNDYSTIDWLHDLVSVHYV